MNRIIKDLNITNAQLRKILLGKKQKKVKILTKHVTDKSFRFGLVSDTHLCSVHERLNELHTFYFICKKMGIKDVVHAGDLLAGWKVYRGQENEVHTFGARNQADYAIANYPKIGDITTYFINGNHDEAWYKLAGIDTGELIAEKRDDMKYLGFYNADIKLNGVILRLHHGDGGGAYALSYKGQKYAEQIPSGKKPRVLVLGHFHTAFYFWYRNIHIINAGCFESQSLYLLRKMLNPAIGGWIIEMKLSKKNEVLAFKPAWIPFFT